MNISPAPIIYWYRNDLRLADLTGLAKAAASGRPVLACYILDEVSAGQWQAGAASRWWLHHSLTALAGDIEAIGGKLHLASGNPETVLADLAKRTGATDIYCSRHYQPWAIALEKRAHTRLAEEGVQLKRFPGTLLWEPENIANQAGLPFKVFTPFWRHCLSQQPPASPVGAPEFVHWYKEALESESLANWQLTPQSPNWAEGWSQIWNPGEASARDRLNTFLDDRVVDYSEGRDRPAQAATSGLSAHLHFGEIAPARVFQQAQQTIAGQARLASGTQKFLSEVGWREFSHHLLFHFPHIPERAFKPKFDSFPTLGSSEQLKCWQRGQTGYPIVDAGMRELWSTGYMHNRVRMLVASFLSKHLLIDWRAGQAWFWDTLVDADLANNASAWQWVAGSGADASPYFRIFNPIIQGEKFDREGVYIKRWLPELSGLSERYIHQPWTAPQEELERAAVTMGKTYPMPMVDHRQAREAALAAYRATSDTAVVDT